MLGDRQTDSRHGQRLARQLGGTSRFPLGLVWSASGVVSRHVSLGRGYRWDLCCCAAAGSDAKGSCCPQKPDRIARLPCHNIPFHDRNPPMEQPDRHPSQPNPTNPLPVRAPTYSDTVSFRGWFVFGIVLCLLELSLLFACMLGVRRVCIKLGADPKDPVKTVDAVLERIWVAPM